MTYEKSNTGQPVNITCIVTGDPVPSADEVTFSYADEVNAARKGVRVKVSKQGQFLAVVFEATPATNKRAFCLVISEMDMAQAILDDVVYYSMYTCAS